MAGIIKISGLDGKQEIKKEELQTLRGKIYILDPENSEIAKRLGITQKGVYGSKFK